MRYNPRKLIPLAAGLLILAVALLAMKAHFDNRRVLTVTTDSAVKLELNDLTYNLSKGQIKSIVLPADSYNYRATATVDGKPIVLTDKLDFVSTKRQTLNLHYEQYSAAAVSAALCKSISQSDGCYFTPATLTTLLYLENYQWAVVTVNNPAIGFAEAVLQNDNGAWVVDDGPGTDIAAAGYYPDSVERALENVQH